MKKEDDVTTPNDIDAALGALAREEARVEVPAHVGAAVMRAWDAGAHATGPRRSARVGFWNVLWPVAVGSIAAMVLALGITRQAPVTLPDLPRGPVVGDGAAAALTRIAAPDPETAAVAPPRASAAPRARRPPAAGRLGFVLVADPAFDPTAATVVRLRMPRATLVSLGVPIHDPDAAGEVDVELLVGEDGIARSIRRARAAAAYEMQE